MKNILILIMGLFLISLTSAQVGNHSLPTDILETCTDGFFYCFSKWASDVTTGTFWVLALITFTVILFIATARFGNVRAFGFASFIGLLGGVWLAVLKLIPWWAGSTFIIVGVVGIMALIISERV